MLSVIDVSRLALCLAVPGLWTVWIMVLTIARVIMQVTTTDKVCFDLEENTHGNETA